MKKVSLLMTAAIVLGGSVALADPPPKSAELLAAGKTSFTTNCASCHGATGLGDGIASAALNPKPRNFKTEEFKFGSSLEAVFATLAKGSPGTAMIAWPHLPESERWALAYYVLDLRGAGGKAPAKGKREGHR
jgi:mono/diheme cytochrome c family protein